MTTVRKFFLQLLGDVLQSSYFPLVVEVPEMPQKKLNLRKVAHCRGRCWDFVRNDSPACFVLFFCFFYLLTNAEELVAFCSSLVFVKHASGCLF